MTISIKLSVTGNYKVPVECKQGNLEVAFTVSGRGHDGPHEHTVPFLHGPDAMTLRIGPEVQDNGEEASE